MIVRFIDRGLPEFDLPAQELVLLRRNGIDHVALDGIIQRIIDRELARKAAGEFGTALSATRWTSVCSWPFTGMAADGENQRTAQREHRGVEGGAKSDRGVGQGQLALLSGDRKTFGKLQTRADQTGERNGPEQRLGQGLCLCRPCCGQAIEAL